MIERGVRKAEEWRAAWANIANRYLEEMNHVKRLDHRSYKRQGISKIPTIHLGVAAHQMEKRGIRTERGDINRAIEISNRKLRQLADQINELQGWLAEERANPEQSIAMPQSELEHLKVIYPQQEQIIMVDDHEQLTDHSPVFAKHVAENSIHKPSAPRTTEPYQPTFTEIISDILSRQGQSVVDAKTTTQILNFLESNDIADYDGLVTHMQNLMGQQRETSHKYSPIRKQQSALFEHIQKYEAYKKNKAKYDQYQQEYKAQLPWKKKVFERDNLWIANNYETSKNALDKLMKGKKQIPISVWEQEYAELSAEIQKLDKQYQALKSEVDKVNKIRIKVYDILRMDKQKGEPKRVQGMNR